MVAYIHSSRTWERKMGRSEIQAHSWLHIDFMTSLTHMSLVFLKEKTKEELVMWLSGPRFDPQPQINRECWPTPAILVEGSSRGSSRFSLAT